MLMKAAITRHLSQDREKRIDYILENFKGEFGEPICKAYTPEKRVLTLTSLGIVIVANEDESTIITMFVANVKETVYIYCTANNTDVCPQCILNRCYKNRKIEKNQP